MAKVTMFFDLRSRYIEETCIYRFNRHIKLMKSDIYTFVIKIWIHVYQRTKASLVK
jgi:hypothetical protein